MQCCSGITIQCDLLIYSFLHIGCVQISVMYLMIICCKTYGATFFLFLYLFSIDLLKIAARLFFCIEEGIKNRLDERLIIGASRM